MREYERTDTSEILYDIEMCLGYLDAPQNHNEDVLQEAQRILHAGIAELRLRFPSGLLKRADLQTRMKRGNTNAID